MREFWQYFRLSAPLFVIVFAGFLIAKWRWRREWTELGSKFVFTVALPALLFHMMTELSALPPVDARLLIAFFGGCFIVFIIGRVIAARLFHLDGVSQSEKPEERTPIAQIRLAADVPATERANLEMLRTDTQTFTDLIESRRNRQDEGYKVPAGRIDVCNVPLPVRPIAR